MEMMHNSDISHYVGTHMQADECDACCVNGGRAEWMDGLCTSIYDVT